MQINKFINQLNVFNKKEIIRAAELYALYIKWCGIINIEPVKMNKFGREVSKLLIKNKDRIGTYYTKPEVNPPQVLNIPPQSTTAANKSTTDKKEELPQWMKEEFKQWDKEFGIC